MVATLWTREIGKQDMCGDSLGNLGTGTSVQKAELLALTWALHLEKGKKVNIYTDFKYAFMVVHAHGSIWKERGLFTSGGKEIKHSQEILGLLKAVTL